MSMNSFLVPVVSRVKTPEVPGLRGTYLETLECGCVRDVKFVPRYPMGARLVGPRGSLRRQLLRCGYSTEAIDAVTEFDPVADLAPKGRKCPIHSPWSSPPVNHRAVQLTFARRMAKRLRERAKQRGLPYP